jgi:sugar-phosphatase
VGRTFAAVLFDMDGTLIDSTPAVVRSWLKWAGEFGIDPAHLTGFHGIPAHGIIAQLLPEHRHAEAVSRIDELELADVDDIALLPGAAGALAALAPHHAAIATSCSRRLAEVRLRSAGVVVPDVVVTIDDTERGKPDPDPFLAAARGLGVDPTDCLVVEDAPGGLTAARAAGAATLAVATTSPREALEANPDADAVVETLADARFEVRDGRVRVTLNHG